MRPTKKWLALTTQGVPAAPNPGRTGDKGMSRWMSIVLNFSRRAAASAA